jgi:hypothetical protein
MLFTAGWTAADRTRFFQQHLGIGIMPVYLLFFAAANILLLEVSYRRMREGDVQSV